MSPTEAIFLGILQGLTEFIPVSSSGHLVIAQSFIPGFSQPGVLFDAIIHAGTMLAILFYFRQKILALSRRTIWLIAIGTVPAALAGITLQNRLEALFVSLQLVGAALLVTGVINWAVDRNYNRRHTTKEMSWAEALIIGVFQAFAIIPGISRSGATIFAGVFQGVRREDAAVFSFLLSIPAVAGAVGLQLLSHAAGAGAQLPAYLLGFSSAFLAGYAAIGIVMRFLLSHRFKVFALYCFLAGLTTLFLAS